MSHKINIQQRANNHKDQVTAAQYTYESVAGIDESTNSLGHFDTHAQ